MLALVWNMVSADDYGKQLLANWHRTKGKKRDALLWGDEVNEVEQ